ncbi:hypothetical protein EVAR_49676_1 [Eumeta japonica]|uniref:Uncharacterized protein n=1 Tax=Eumeta variegata TaxID=151549 RepID=A0A4C1WT42_EUMVA|nr:hypothetical protein EVAR_49676_1 [Eumeta japonica]
MDFWGDVPFLFHTRGINMNKKTTTQRKRRLEKAKLKRQERIANESVVHKRQRLEKIRIVNIDVQRFTCRSERLGYISRAVAPDVTLPLRACAECYRRPIESPSCSRCQLRFHCPDISTDAAGDPPLCIEEGIRNPIEGGECHQNSHSLDEIQQHKLLLHVCVGEFPTDQKIIAPSEFVYKQLQKLNLGTKFQVDDLVAVELRSHTYGSDSDSTLVFNPSSVLNFSPAVNSDSTSNYSFDSEEAEGK